MPGFCHYLVRFNYYEARRTFVALHLVDMLNLIALQLESIYKLLTIVRGSRRGKYNITPSTRAIPVIIKLILPGAYLCLNLNNHAYIRFKPYCH